MITKVIYLSISIIFGILIEMFICKTFYIKFKISENKGSGEDLINLKNYIIKHKLPINSSGTYNIISNEPDINNYFILQLHSGILRQRNNIDRETMCKHADICQKIILISISGQVLEVMVDIEDENDNIPQFSMRHKTLSIQENSDIGSELSLPTADDLDSEPNSIILYSIKDIHSRDNRRMNQFQASRYFTILIKTMNRIKIPYLKLIKEIDREEIDRFELILIAEDSGKQQGSCTITVSIIDVNDNSPQWPTVNISKTVKECDRQGPLVELQAFDRDDSSTPNGQIKYKISDNSPKKELINRLFYIAGSSLFLSSQGLQLMDLKTYITFFITAIDGGGRENSTAVTIEIEDCNDHAPYIAIYKSTASVRENDRSPMVLTSVMVNDDDKGINSQFNCDLNDTTYFTMVKEDVYNQSNGRQLFMYNIKKIPDTFFDRETLSFYSVLIRCIDLGRPPLVGEKLFSVTIIDENDNPPKFGSNEIRFTLTENNNIGAPIGYVRAFDPDSNENGRVSYQILNNDENYYFTITSSGKIEAKWKFDREIKDQYSLTIMAKDNGEPSLNDTCIVYIRILDVNDCVPIFKQQYFYQITEGNGLATIHAILGKVTADDKDLGENGTVYYTIRQKYDHSNRQNNIGLNLLKINLEGILNIYGVVDREQMVSIQAEIIAYDNGKPQLSAVANVIVDVLDVNDNKPKFKYPINKMNFINISTDLQVGKVLANFEAEDPDKGENGTITYSIIGHKNMEQNLPYQLQNDGRLILTKSLREREDVRLPDRLIIRASDNGTPPKAELVTVNIRYIPSIQNPRNNVLPPGINKKSNDKTRFSGGHVDNYRESDSTDNMTLLYILVGILFVVFIIVLLVLVYTYFSGRFSRSRQLDLTHEKELNNYYTDGTGNYECDLLNANAASCQEDFSKMAMGSIPSPATDKNNYTHLMRMNEAKYTPIHLNSNYIQSLCSSGSLPVQSSILQANSENSRNYEQCIQTRRELNDKPIIAQIPGNKWNSIENVALSNNGFKSSIKSHDNSFFYNAHSYAAYINQFGVEEKDSSSVVDDNPSSNKTKIKQQTLNASHHKKSPKDEQQLQTYQPVVTSFGSNSNNNNNNNNNASTKSHSKKCYVSSSFV